MWFADFASMVSAVAFTIAAVYGFEALRQGARLRATIIYITVVAAANAAFRYYASWIRVNDYEFPQPVSSDIALVLQISLAVSLLLIASVARLQTKAMGKDG